MKFSRSVFLVLLLSVVSISSMIALAESPDEKKDICINWAFGALTGPQDNRKLIPITKDTTLKTGDQFKMMVELKSMCFVYLIYHGSSGEIQLLFPNTLKQFDSDYHIAKKYYIPQSDLWLALDEHTGRETFYLLVSKIRMSELEDLLQKYQSTSSAKKSEVVLEIIEHVKQIRKQHFSFSSKAERPLSIGGSVRGVQKQSASLHDVAALSVEISATEFFGRTFTIEHE